MPVVNLLKDNDIYLKHQMRTAQSVYNSLAPKHIRPSLHGFRPPHKHWTSKLEQYHAEQEEKQRQAEAGEADSTT